MAGLRSVPNAQPVTLVLDIESGSVGVYLVGDSGTRVLYKKRSFFIPDHRVHSEELFASLCEISERLLTECSEWIATQRVRALSTFSVTQGVIFASAPWAAFHFVSSKDLRIQIPEHVVHTLSRQVYALFGDIPIVSKSFSRTAAQVLGESQQPLLLLIAGGEVSDLMLVDHGHIRARSTFPSGVNSVMRTISLHTGMPHYEVRSALKLAPSGYLHDVLAVAHEHFLNQIQQALRSVGTKIKTQDVIVLSHKPFDELFACALTSEPSISRYFAAGGVVRALQPSYFESPLAEAQDGDIFVHIGARSIRSSAHV